jgi:hypothetical protein
VVVASGRLVIKLFRYRVTIDDHAAVRNWIAGRSRSSRFSGKAHLCPAGLAR